MEVVHLRIFSPQFEPITINRNLQPVHAIYQWMKTTKEWIFRIIFVFRGRWIFENSQNYLMFGGTWKISGGLDFKQNTCRQGKKDLITFPALCLSVCLVYLWHAICETVCLSCTKLLAPKTLNDKNLTATLKSHAHAFKEAVYDCIWF